MSNSYDLEAKRKERKKVLLLTVVMAGLLFSRIILNALYYDYFISLQCSKSGECRLIKNSISKKTNEPIPVSSINGAVVNVYTVSTGKSTATYHDLILKTTQGDIPILTKDGNSHRIKVVNDAESKINDFVKDKNKTSLNINIDRMPYLRFMATVSGVLILLLILILKFIVFRPNKLDETCPLRTKQQKESSEQGETTESTETIDGKKVIFKVKTSFKINKKL